MKRISAISRKTKETDINLTLNIDGEGNSSISTGIGFFDHMLTAFSKNSLIDLRIKTKGDLNIDDHHTVEDIGIVIGQSILDAIGDKKGIKRYGFFILTMDESLATVAIDLSGRYSFNLSCDFNREKVGELSTELVYDFFDAIAQNAKMNIFIKVENGRNDHHKIEAIFKAFGRALRMACEFDERIKNQIPSTKGSL